MLSDRQRDEALAITYLALQSAAHEIAARDGSRTLSQWLKFLIVSGGATNHTLSAEERHEFQENVLPHIFSYLANSKPYQDFIAQQDAGQLPEGLRERQARLLEQQQQARADWNHANSKRSHSSMRMWIPLPILAEVGGLVREYWASLEGASDEELENEY